MFRLSLLSLLTTLLPFTLSAPARTTERDVNVGWPYGQQKIRGVNIGGVSKVLWLWSAADFRSGWCSSHGSRLVTRLDHAPN